MLVCLQSVMGNSKNVICLFMENVICLFMENGQNKNNETSGFFFHLKGET
jgi:hypothetical protein